MASQSVHAPPVVMSSCIVSEEQEWARTVNRREEGRREQEGREEAGGVYGSNRDKVKRRGGEIEEGGCGRMG